MANTLLNECRFFFCWQINLRQGLQNEIQEFKGTREPCEKSKQIACG